MGVFRDIWDTSFLLNIFILYEKTKQKTLTFMYEVPISNDKKKSDPMGYPWIFEEEQIFVLNNYMKVK